MGNLQNINICCGSAAPVPVTPSAKDEGIPPLFYADETYIFNRLRICFPDITMERVRHIIRKMEQHGFLIHQNGQWHSVKIPMANLPLKEK